MRYTDEVIENVREHNDIVDVISEHVKLQRRGNSYVGLCPFHNEKTPSFNVSQDKQMYYCFGCQAGGNVFSFEMQYNNYTFQEAMQVLAERAGIELPQSEPSAAQKEKASKDAMLREINKTAAEHFYVKMKRPGGEKAAAYLKGRGLTDETIRNFGLGYAGKGGNELYNLMKKKGYPDQLLKESGLFHYDEKRGFTDTFWNRVMYPIMDKNSRVIGFGGRVMGDGEPKYLNSPETPIFNKRMNLYGLNYARRTRRRNFIICEGYMDVISMHQAGYTNAVASLGTALTPEQCNLMKRFTKEVLVIYDMDGAGVKAAMRAIPMLRSAGLATKVVNLRPHKDPDEFIKTEGVEAFEKRLEEAENSFLFMIRMKERDYDMKDPQGFSDFLHEVEKMLGNIEDEIERTSYLKAVAHRYQIDPEILRKGIGMMEIKGGINASSVKPSIERKRNGPVSKKTELSLKQQKILLTWLVASPELIRKVSLYLQPQDFNEGLVRRIAEYVWTHAGDAKIGTASIVNQFEDEEEQSKAMAIISADMAIDDEKDKRNALFDLICQIRKNGIDNRAAALDPTDMAGLMKIMKERRELETFIQGGPPADLLS